jgi:hypothetical protein
MGNRYKQNERSSHSFLEIHRKIMEEEIWKTLEATDFPCQSDSLDVLWNIRINPLVLKK